MPISTRESRKLVGADGTELDATFRVEQSDDGTVSVVFESGGGGTRNTEYRKGLELLLERLRIMGASLEDAVIDTRDTATLAPDDRRLVLPGWTYPIALDAEQDIPSLRKALSAAQARVGRAPGASGGGNTNKRIRLTLGFATSLELDPDEFEDALALGSDAQTNSGDGVSMFLARVCWNSSGWVHPTGDSTHLEAKTYVAQYGFGHEEWLFNLAWVLDDGYHYAYLQSIRPSWQRLQGQTVCIRLFTIAPGGERFYVGELRSCDVLTEEQAEAASKEYKKRGWTKEMHNQVVDVEGEPRGLAGSAINRFNVRFRPEDATYFAPHRRATTSLLKDRYLRYRSYNWTPELTADFGEAAITSTTAKTPKKGVESKSKNTIHRSGVGSSSYDPIHNILQEELRDLLIAQYGANAVTMEEDHVDLKVRLKNRLVFIELKTAPSARLAVREAVGQLLEYAHFRPTSDVPAPELVVVAPAVPNQDETAYIERLKAEFNLPLTYRTYQRGVTTFKL